MNLELEAYLNHIQIQEEVLQEFEPISGSILATAGLVAGAAVIADIITTLIAVAQYRNQVKVDKVWSKRLNNILGTNDWKVHLIPDKWPNGFSVGGKHVFITTGLVKEMTQREVEAIMLHEVYHSQAKHVSKRIAYEAPFFYMIVFIGMTITLSVSIPFLGVLAYLVMRSIPHIAYAVLAGRRHEIKADQNTVKYGYGDDLISSLNKVEKKMKEQISSGDCGFLCKAINKINDAIDEHPPIQKRIEQVLKKSKELDKMAKSKNFRRIKKFVMGVFKK
jgi:Zn-dependent protease with chaperone function